MQRPAFDLVKNPILSIFSPILSSNRPFPSCFKPLFQSEAKYKDENDFFVLLQIKAVSCSLCTAFYRNWDFLRSKDAMTVKMSF